MLRWYMKPFLLLLVASLVLSSIVTAQDFYLCTRVIDGDTIAVEKNGKKEKVRLIGVDTPETVHPSKPVEYFGKEASEFTRKNVEGKRVNLEYDWQSRDKYGRLLAYVYIEDGTFLNAEIIRQGYGFAYTRYPFKYLEEFRRFEREARETPRGLSNGRAPPQPRGGERVGPACGHCFLADALRPALRGARPHGSPRGARRSTPSRLP